MTNDGPLLPLSIEQEWFYAQRLDDPGSRISITRAFDIHGELDVDRLLRCLADVVARHDGLRTKIAFTSLGEPHQVVLPAADHPPPITCQAIAARSADQFRAYARAIASRDLHERWDPVADPMYRLVLLRRSPDEHILLCTFDHIAFDGRAVEIVAAELWARYLDADSAAPEREATLAACLERERRRFGRRAATVSAAHRAERYAAAPPVLQLAGPKRARGLADSRRRSLPYRPEPGLDGKLTEAGRAAGVSRFELFTAAFAVAAFPLTDQHRLPIYIPMNCRENADNNMVGNFAGVGLITPSREAARELPSALAEIKQALLRALAHRHVDYAMEQRALDVQANRWGLRPVRQLGVNYMPVYESGARPETSAPGIRLELNRYSPPVPVRGTTLTLSVRDYGDEFMAAFDYSSDLDDLIHDVVGRFGSLLELVAAGLPGVGSRQDPARPERAADSGLTALRFADGGLCLRVDLAEVRAALLGHEAVREADVDVAEHDDGGSEVVARVRLTSEVTDDALRRACLTWPEASQFMVPPARFVRSG